MSDLAATNCNTGCDCNGDNGCSCIIWILLLLTFCGGNNGFGGCGCGNNDSNCIIWILLILCFCGNGNSCF